MNRIKGLRDYHRVWHNELEQVEVLCQSHFLNLFSSTNPSAEMIQQVTRVVFPKVSEADNAFLCRDFNSSDVRNALFQMHPNKSSGPDGFSPHFYQWHGTLLVSLFLIFALIF